MLWEVHIVFQVIFWLNYFWIDGPKLNLSLAHCALQCLIIFLVFRLNARVYVCVSINEYTLYRLPFQPQTFTTAWSFAVLFLSHQRFYQLFHSNTAIRCCLGSLLEWMYSCLPRHQNCTNLYAEKLLYRFVFLFHRSFTGASILCWCHWLCSGAHHHNFHFSATIASHFNL